MTAKKKSPPKRAAKKAPAKQTKPKTAAKKKVAAEPPKFGTPEWREKYMKKGKKR